MKDSIREDIGIWKEILRAVLYAWILEISSTIARLVNSKQVDIWSFCGIIGGLILGLIFLLVLFKLQDLKNKLKEIDCD